MGLFNGFVDFVTLGGGSDLKSLWDDFTGKSAIDKQNQYNIEMWNMQNEYNTPANQVARLRAAGLNPNLFYSQGNPGNASSAPEMTAHQGSVNKLLGLLGTVISLKGQLQNQALEKANTLSSIEHSKEVLEYQKRKALVDEAFRAAELNLHERDLGLRTSWKDREYALSKERLDFERSKPYGGAVGFMDKVLQGVTGQSTSDIAGDIGSGLNNFFSKGFENALRYDWKKGASGNVGTWLLRKLSGL